MEEIIFQMIQMEQQMRIFHWQTKSYARHQAFGMVYGALGELIDSFVEAAMGKYGRVKVGGPIELDNIGSDIEGKVDEYITFLVGVTDKLDQANDTDLLNIRDEILGLMNKLKYLLTLK